MAAKKKSTKKKVARKKKAVKKASKKKAKSTRKKAAKKTTKKAAKKSSGTTTHQAAHRAAQAAATAMRDIIVRARDHFRQAPHDRHFVLSTGQSLKDLRQLAEAMDDMQDHVFFHHVNDDKHDFANWVHEILHERALAEELRQAERSQRHNQNVIYRHIVRRVW